MLSNHDAYRLPYISKILNQGGLHWKENQHLEIRRDMYRLRTRIWNQEEIKGWWRIKIIGKEGEKRKFGIFKQKNRIRIRRKGRRRSEDAIRRCKLVEVLA